jgi:uncharacterized protein YndB with AHSA1/START domain
VWVAVFGLWCALGGRPPAAVAQVEAGGTSAIEDVSYRDDAGRRVLAVRTTVDAPVGEVWGLWTTSQGLGSWMAPVVGVELEVGGVWEASYDRTAPLGADGNIRNEILAYVPSRMFAMRVAAVPPGYPFPLETVREAHTVYVFDPVSEASTRITVYGMGYGEGPLWDTMYDVGVQTTQYTLAEFRNRLLNGPVNWDAR